MRHRPLAMLAVAVIASATAATALAAPNHGASIEGTARATPGGASSAGTALATPGGASTAGTALATPPHGGAAAKRCYASKHGKRVRVRCPTKPKPPTATPPGPQNDPALAARWSSLLAGQMLHRFSTSASPSELLLHLCAGSAYQYLDFADTTGTASGNGLWRVTGAEQTPPGVTLGLMLVPANASPARFLVLQLTDNGDGTYTVLVNGDRWYLSTSTLCPPG